MQETNNHIEVVATVERRVAALMRDGLSRREAYLEIKRTTPLMLERFRKVASAEQLRDLTGAETELSELRRKLNESQKQVAELTQELASLRSDPAEV